MFYSLEKSDIQFIDCLCQLSWFWINGHDTKGKEVFQELNIAILNFMFQVNFDETVMEKSLMSVSELDPLPSSQETQFDINELVDFPVLSCVPITRE